MYPNPQTSRVVSTLFHLQQISSRSLHVYAYYVPSRPRVMVIGCLTRHFQRLPFKNRTKKHVNHNARTYITLQHENLNPTPLKTFVLASSFCTGRIKVTGLAQFVDELPSLNSRPTSHNQPSSITAIPAKSKKKQMRRKKLQLEIRKNEIGEAKSSLGQRHHPHSRAIVPPVQSQYSSGCQISSLYPLMQLVSRLSQLPLTCS